MNARNSWMSGKFGVMIHYLPPLLETQEGEHFKTVDEYAECFNVPAFMEQVDASGADYLIFTIGQNTGLYNAPNSVLESRIGDGHCAKRDLPLELAKEMKKRGKRFIAYLPLEVNHNKTIKDKLSWIDSEQRIFQPEFWKLWLEVIREWALRYGDLLDGWYFDGINCLKTTDEDIANLHAAARAGNPNAVITKNGAGFDSWIGGGIRGDEDYFSGEVTLLKDGLPYTHWRDYSEDIKIMNGMTLEAMPMNLTFKPESAYMPGYPGLLAQALVPIDAYWVHGCSVEWLKDQPVSRYIDPKTLAKGELEPPIYSLDELDALQKAFLSVGGAVTLNMGVYSDGSFHKDSLELLKQLKAKREGK